jgi:hypothetical protein
MRLSAILLALFISVTAWANQVNLKQLQTMEDSLSKMQQAIFKGKDQNKLAANERFSDLLKKALDTEGAFDYPFDSLKGIGRLTAPDQAFRIFNWNLPKDDGTQLYLGFIIVNENKIKKVKGKYNKPRYVIYELEDKSDEIRNPELAQLSPEKWYGALYYKIIKTSDKSDDYYTLLGWDGNNHMTWKKIIEVVTFTRDGRPIFGEKNLLHRGKRSSRRVIFEYRADLIMTLKWEDDNNRIVFDRLAPEVAGAEGMYQFYSQTFVYDAFLWKKGKWLLQEDVEVKNDKSKTDEKYIPPQGDQNPGNGKKPSANQKPPKPPKKHGKLYNLLHSKKKDVPLSGAG